ncbi:MAG: neuromedin U, partial [Gammaproteobacteria bacterium]|nr:neuromedin U [Gammaproteobacteria bacterium]
MLLQPFVNFNLSRGWYLVTAPIITAQWEAEKLDDRWTVPVGAGVGKILRLFVPLNLSAQYYYNVETPKRTGAMWQLRLQLQLL